MQVLKLMRWKFSLSLLMATGLLSAQESIKKYPAPQLRFEGSVQVGPANARQSVQSEMRTWIFPPGLKGERLLVPDDAMVIIELHSGSLETLVADKREPRKPGTIWLVQPGESISISTENDSVTLTTIALRPR